MLRDPSVEEERAWGEFMKDQFDALKVGREIEPPWVVFRGAEPWNFKQGYNESWMQWIWMPFWKSLNTEEKRGYVHKWNATDYWEELMLGSWLLLGDPEEERKKEERRQLLNAQTEALRQGKEVEPPWNIFQGIEPLEYTTGSILEGWLNRVWMPFWKRLTQEERRAYVEKRNPPPLWRDLLLGTWLDMDTEEKNSDSERSQ